jgi:hypothetical protein
MSWRNFKNSQFKDKSYEKAHISTFMPRGNKDKRCKSSSFEPFEPFGLKDKTENLVVPVGQSPDELKTVQDFQKDCDSRMKVSLSCVGHEYENTGGAEQSQDTDEETKLVGWFLTATLPTEAFNLDCARRVNKPGKFFDVLRREIAGRLSSPRWRCGATQADLRRLKENSLNNNEGGVKGITKLMDAKTQPTDAALIKNLSFEKE